jgi:benzoate-CoA ligase family protein
VILRAHHLPLQYNAVDILERNLPDRADKVALCSIEGEYTFGRMASEVNQVGHALQNLGVRPSEYVALLALDCPEWVASFFGIIKIGAVAASLNTLLTPEEYRYMLADCRARVLIVQDSLVERIDTVRDQLPHLEHVVVIGQGTEYGHLAYGDWIAGKPTALVAEDTHRDDFCCLNYTSGTTGEPKGILHAHKDLPLTAQLWGVDVLGLTAADRTFAVAKLFFTFGTGGNLIFPWYVGASVVLFSGPPRVATNILAVIDRFKPTILYNAPTSYAALLAVDNFHRDHDLSSLRLCVSAGESLPAPIWHQWKAATGLDIVDGLGSTENFHIFISNRPGDIRPGSSGTPVPGYEVRIVDEEGHDVSQGTVGNLLVKGETAALCYLHQYEKSRRTFLGEWLNTSDRYYVDSDGYYWHAGRSDDMLKVGGIWVSPVEVESALLTHPAAQEAAVVGMADPSGLIKPMAYVVLAPGYEPSDALAADLIARCRDTMADYKRPRWVRFVDELPKTATGKIQRFRLRG